jgi:hypothetical protein
MQWANILVGAVVLLFGRKLFWLFVGGVGFIVGFEIAHDLLQNQPDWLILLVAFCIGVLGALASIFLQRLVVSIAGFFAGGYFLSALSVTLIHNNYDAVRWASFIIGGVLGMLMTIALLDPALILLSSLAGATAISQHLPLEQSAKEILFIVLMVVGIVVQAMQYEHKAPPPSTKS